MTINLNEYDVIKQKVDKSKTWLYVKGKSLISNELPKRKYYNLFKRYNPQKESYEFFIILSDVNTNNSFKTTNIDAYNRIKISISSIYQLSGLHNETEDCNITLRKVDCDENSDVYAIDY